MEQGEVWWANFPPPAGKRPVIILTWTGVIRHLSHITVAPVTRSIRPIRTRVRLTAADGMYSDCAASLANIQTIDKRLLEEKIVRVRSERMKEVFAAIRTAFDMPG